MSQRVDDLETLRNWLRGCRYVSDQDQFGEEDFWMPPEEFERLRTGDCEDFALWTWRQLMEMGLNARFVAGRAGRYGNGHAWVTFADERKHYLVEPLAAGLGPALPRLTALRYQPAVSASWDGDKVRFFTHESRDFEIRLRELPELVAEWLRIFVPAWTRAIVRVPRVLLRKAVRWLRTRGDA